MVIRNFHRILRPGWKLRRRKSEEKRLGSVLVIARRRKVRRERRVILFGECRQPPPCRFIPFLAVTVARRYSGQSNLFYAPPLLFLREYIARLRELWLRDSQRAQIKAACCPLASCLSGCACATVVAFPVCEVNSARWNTSSPIASTNEGWKIFFLRSNSTKYAFRKFIQKSLKNF